jgi:hypothetical protein
MPCPQEDILLLNSMLEFPNEVFQPILNELKRLPLEKNEYRLNSGSGRSQAFGIVNRRCLPPDYSRQCWKRAYLYKLLLEFGEKYVPIPFNAITVNQNYQASPHYDKNNVGQSFLIAFGDYEGGELEIHEGPRKGIHDLRHKPMLDDFSKILHSVKEFKGERYSLVYYTFQHPSYIVNVPPPSVREVDGKWRFFRGEELCKGLDHPLKGTKHSKKQEGITLKSSSYS